MQDFCTLFVSQEWGVGDEAVGQCSIHCVGKHDLELLMFLTLSS